MKYNNKKDLREKQIYNRIMRQIAPIVKKEVMINEGLVDNAKEKLIKVKNIIVNIANKTIQKVNQATIAKATDIIAQNERFRKVSLKEYIKAFQSIADDEEQLTPEKQLAIKIMIVVTFVLFAPSLIAVIIFK